MAQLENLNLDAWSDGQIQSKLWLCRELEKIWTGQDSHFWVYGSWYGTLAQMLLQRDRIKVKQFQLFDLDDSALEVSKKINLTWQIHQIANFVHHQLDCESISTSQILNEKPDLIINTSCEHFESFNWFRNLPRGQKFLVQSTDMSHETHILKANHLDHFISQLGSISNLQFSGELPFNYPQNSFRRFMVMGTK